MKTVIYCEDKYGRRKDIATLDGAITIEAIVEAPGCKWWPLSYDLFLSDGSTLNVTEYFEESEIKSCIFR